MATSHDQTKKKVFKHILCNPFAGTWPMLTQEQTQSFTNVLYREIEAQAIPAQMSAAVSGKKVKVGESNLVACAKLHLILGINQIAEQLEKISVVVVLRGRDNQALVEPLYHLCRSKQVRILAVSYDVAIERMNQLTGVRRLAAFAVPKLHNLPITMGFLTHHAKVLPPTELLPIVMRRMDTSKKVTKETDVSETNPASS